MIETDVVVVGGGPVGLSLALELGLQGRRCVEGIEVEGDAGDAARAAVGAQILSYKRREFDAPGIVLGSRLEGRGCGGVSAVSA